MLPFTPLFDWVAQRKDLTILEKVLISKVLRFADNGCYESSANLAKDFGLDRRTVQRSVKDLIQKEWLIVFYERKPKRTLYIAPDKLKAGPLFGSSDVSEKGSIYFLQVADSGPVKIGFTTKPIKQRIMRLQVSSPEKLVLLGYIKGSIEQEKKLHERFTNLKLHNEWYEPGDNLLKVVRELCETGGVRSPSGGLMPPNSGVRSPTLKERERSKER